MSPMPTLHEDWIDSHAARIVEVLQKSGFESYLVGGCVRDLLIGAHPKDYDIATNAQPNDVRRKVPNSYVIGRRFRLVLVKRGLKQYEVATFRRNRTIEDPVEEEGENPIGDNFFGTAEEDAKRRDFTINALFYDPIHHKLIDYCNGKADLEGRWIRMIGEPGERLVEDPIRILRAIRFAHKLNFSIEPSLRAAIQEKADQLKLSALPRKREEYLKILRLDEPWRVFHELYDLGVLQHILPGLHDLYQDPVKIEIFESVLTEIKGLFLNHDKPEELFSILVWAVVRAQYGEVDFATTDLSEHPRLLIFMKEELGMFKLEMSQFFKAVSIIPSLLKKQSYMKRGARRKINFLRQEAFTLALKLAKMDQTLIGPDYFFWQKELEKSYQVPQEANQEVQA
jgi:poly(A) polymerase